MTPTASPTPRTRWYASQTSVESLREILATPALIQATGILLDEQMPGMESINGKTIEQVLKQHAYLAGYRDAFRHLEALTRHPRPLKQDGLQEWTHIGVTDPNSDSI